MNVSSARLQRLVSEGLRRLRPGAEPEAPPTYPLSSHDVTELGVLWPATLEWPTAATWVDGLRRELRKRTRFTVAEIPQAEGVVAFDVRRAGQRRRVVVDYHDHHDHLDEAMLRDAVVYFKMQFVKGGYGDPRVIPGGYVNAAPAVYHHLPVIHTLHNGSGEQYHVYGRFGLRFQRELRLRAVEALRSDSRFVYEGGAKLVRYSEFLEECARASVCVDMPGNGDFCFRLVDYLAIGCTVVAWPHRTTFPVPLQDGVHLRYCREDLSDLADICAELVADPGQCRRLGASARDYFDRYLHRAQLASYYLSEIFARTS